MSKPPNTSLLRSARDAIATGLDPKAVRGVLKATAGTSLAQRRKAAALIDEAAKKTAPALDEDDDDGEPELDEAVPPLPKKKTKKAKKPASTAALDRRLDVLEDQAARAAQAVDDASVSPELLRQVEAHLGASTPRQARTALERARIYSGTTLSENGSNADGLPVPINHEDD
jgi:hypothetical protein